jgi:hypothetical protein
VSNKVTVWAIVNSIFCVNFPTENSTVLLYRFYTLLRMIGVDDFWGWWCSTVLRVRGSEMHFLWTTNWHMVHMKGEHSSPSVPHALQVKEINLSESGFSRRLNWCSCRMHCTWTSWSSLSDSHVLEKHTRQYKHTLMQIHFRILYSSLRKYSYMAK